MSPVLQVAQRVANEHGLRLEELVSPGGPKVRTELARARHHWRALVASSLGYGEPQGVELAELGRLLDCDRKTVWASLRAAEALGYL